MNEIEKKKVIKYKKYFLLFLTIVFLINIYLLYKNKDRCTFIILLFGLIIELCIYIVLINNEYKLLEILHNAYFILLMIGTLLFKNIYLLFIIFIIFISFVTREIFDVCLFSSHEKKTSNGTITIIVLLLIILFKIYREKMYNNLLKF